VLVRFVFRFGSYGRPEYELSFSDAKLAEYRIENLFHIHDANDLADCAQRLIKINRNVLAGQSFAHRAASQIA